MIAFVLGLFLGGSAVVVGFALGGLFLAERRPDVLDRLLAKDRTLTAVDAYRASTAPRPRPSMSGSCVRYVNDHGFGVICPLHHVDHSREGTS